jgi:insertion element IS1 protein InsB
VWVAVDRNKNKIIDIQVTESREFCSYYPMALRLEQAYNIKHLCTDYYDVYSKYKIAKHHHRTKSETSLVESKNSLIRHYLARFNRKTKRYSKSIDMITHSLFLLFFKDFLSFVI